jgi:hypothetical protein
MPGGIPDMRYINRQIRIFEVARALDLRTEGSTKIHCWHPGRHQHGDRTASVGIRTVNNTVKCFVCDFNPMGPIDLVMDVLSISPGEAALWIADRFKVPLLPRRRLSTPAAPFRVGHERGLGLLIRSGLWGTLSQAARCVAPVLLEMASQDVSSEQELTLQISYAGISRYSGVRSHRAIRAALVDLAEIGFLRRLGAAQPRTPERSASRYFVTPGSNDLWDAANGFAAQFRSEIAAEKELRKRAREKRISLMKGAAA